MRRIKHQHYRLSISSVHSPARIKTLLTVCALAAFAAICPVSAESFEVIAVKNADLKPYQEVLRGLRDACGCNIRELTLREEEGRDKALQTHPDAVVAIGTTVFKKLRKIKEVPVIYTMVIPSEAALSPQPNISGVSMDISPSSYISSMREVIPGVKRIGLLYDPKHTQAFVEEAAKAARAAGIELVNKQVRDPLTITSSLEEMRDAIDTFWMVPDPTVVTAETVEFLLRFSFQHNVPIFSFSKKYVEMGAIAALDFDPYDIGVQAGEILKNLSAGRTDPVRVYARMSHLSVNKNVAAKMGLKIQDEKGKSN